MNLKRIPPSVSWGRLEQEYANSESFILRLPDVDRTEIESVGKKEDSIVIKICNFLDRLTSANHKEQDIGSAGADAPVTVRVPLGK